MDALLIALVAGMLAEFGARTQHVLGWLIQKGMNVRLALVLLVSALLASLAFSAAGGALIGATMPRDATTLLLGIALVFAGIAQLRPIRDQADEAASTHPVRALIRLGAAHFADGTPLLAFAVAARTNSATLTLIGSLIAVLVACLPMIIDLGMRPRTSLQAMLRRVAALFLMLTGVGTALSGLRVI